MVLDEALRIEKGPVRLKYFAAIYWAEEELRAPTAEATEAVRRAVDLAGHLREPDVLVGLGRIITMFAEYTARHDADRALRAGAS